jgi:hypothetical protein
MKPKIYAYYESIQMSNQPEEFACANIWKESWEKNGWEAVMLNNSHAKGSNLYQKLVTRILKTLPHFSLEDQNNLQRVMVRFTRWCALHAARGGWMSDYDCVNVGFSPQDADELAKSDSLIVIGKPSSYLFYANHDICGGTISKFIADGIMNGSSISSESELLNFSKEYSDMDKKIVHVRKSDGKTKSEAMKSIYAEFISVPA